MRNGHGHAVICRKRLPHRSADAILTAHLSGCTTDAPLDRETGELLIKAAAMRVALAIGTLSAITILLATMHELEASHAEGGL